MTPLRVTEVGTERRCNSCRTWWPLDPEFYHRNGKGVAGFLGTCRACYVERRRKREEARRLRERSELTLWNLAS
jgi:hypothetical protein